jgi:6-phosphogluconolactonase
MHPALSALGVSTFMALAAAARADPPSCWVYFGTSATASNRGLYLSKLNQDTGALSAAVRVAEKSDSVFVAFSPDRRHLYSLAEIPRPGGRPAEAIETYEVDAATGALRNIGERAVDGSEACHISVDPSGRCVLTANYDAHYVEVFPILGEDSTVGERSCLIRHSGSGPNASRQESAHPHSINVDPSGRFAIVADLGLDRLYVYRLDAARGITEAERPPIRGRGARGGSAPLRIPSRRPACIRDQ